MNPKIKKNKKSVTRNLFIIMILINKHNNCSTSFQSQMTNKHLTSSLTDIKKRDDKIIKKKKKQNYTSHPDYFYFNGKNISFAHPENERTSQWSNSSWKFVCENFSQITHFYINSICKENWASHISCLLNVVWVADVISRNLKRNLKAVKKKIPRPFEVYVRYTI